MKLFWKKYIFTFVFLLFILIFFAYYNKYSINDSNKSIEYYLVKNRFIDTKDALIQKQVVIKNIKIVLFKWNGNRLYYAFFEKGLNGKYHFIQINSPSALIDCDIVKIQSDYYLISLGYNVQNKLYSNTTLSSAYDINKTIVQNFTIKNEEYFIKYKVIPNQSNNNYLIKDKHISNIK